MRYEIDDSNTIRFYQGDEDVPFLLQPDYPDFTKFQNREEATAWAELFYKSMIDETAPYAPNGRGIPAEPRVLIVEK